MALTRPLRSRLGALALAACLVGLAAPASAWHEPSRPVTDYSAATLNGGEWRIYVTGLLEYGITDNFEIGTMPLLDIARVPNLVAKWSFIPGEGFSMAASGGIITTNAQYFNDLAPDVQVYFIPVALFASWRLPGGDVAVHGGLHYATVGTSGSSSVSDAFGIDAALRGSSLKLAPVLELRTSRGFAWVLEGSVSLSQNAEVAGSTTYTSEDGRTTVEIFASGGIDDAGDKWLANASVSAYWSWDVFNLKLGVVYGHVELPLVGVFVDQLSILPKFNMYWRF